jgi:enterobacterial common antigen flippase
MDMAEDKGTDKQILKSTFIMGSSSVINSLMGIVRTKIIALMLGPSGMGLTGIYITITNLFSTFSGMGIGESGVRQIAEAVHSEKPDVVPRTVRTVRRLAFVSGATGLTLLFIFSPDVSSITFGNPHHALDVALLSMIIFFTALTSGQTSLIQGMRRIGDLAKVTVCGAILGTIFSIPAIYFFGERGIALYLIIVSAAAFAASWWFSSRITVPVVRVSWGESLREAKPLLKLGVALMLGALMAAGTQYLLRVLIVRKLGLDAAGAYHASTTLSLVYVGIILNAMLTDFYPRLSAVCSDHDECRSLINKQVEVGLLLAVPGILAIMTFAPVVIVIFYSSKFMLAVQILKWQILGVLLQVVSWPMGFMLRAKAAGKLFFFTEFIANALNLTLSWLGIGQFGLPGIGMAFFGTNLIYWITIFCIIKANYDFAFSKSNIQIFTLFAVATGSVFLAPFFLPKLLYLALNSGVTLAVATFSLWSLWGKTDTGMIPGLFLRIKARFGI